MFLLRFSSILKHSFCDMDKISWVDIAQIDTKLTSYLVDTQAAIYRSILVPPSNTVRELLVNLCTEMKNTY